MKSTIAALAIIVLSVCWPATAWCQAAPCHPDGVVGRFGGWIGGSYASPLGKTQIPVADRSRLGLGIKFPVARQVTCAAGYSLTERDSAFHEYSLALKVYLRDPLKSHDMVNPDGRIGTPVVSVLFEGILPDRKPGDHRYKVCLQSLMPVSRNLTVGGGWRYYEDGDPFQVDEYFAEVRLFLKGYLAGEEYLNPDGIEGTPSFAVTGGGSGNGFHGEMDVIVPLSARASIGFFVRGERVASPYFRIAELGGRICVYPGTG